MTTLVMFSGGLDSTAMLVKLLTTSADELRVHHIRMVTRERRDRAESRAVESIVAYCRARYRPFRTSESALDFSGLEAIPIDYVSIAFVACQVAIDTPGCDRIAIGSLAADTDIANRTARMRRVSTRCMPATGRASWASRGWTGFSRFSTPPRPTWRRRCQKNC